MTTKEPTEIKSEAPVTSEKVDFTAPTESALGKEEAKDGTRNWMQIAEVRMVLYVIPVGIVIAIISYILSRLGH